MKKISTIARVTEVDALSNAILRLWAQSGLQDDAFLKAQFAELQSLSDSLTAAIRRDKTESDLDEKDAVRDEALRNLAAMIEGWAACPIPSKKASALSLKATFDKYGRKIALESYANESSLVESLLQDLDEKSADIDKFEGMAEQVSLLRQAERDFDSAYDGWMKARRAEGKAASATGTKKPLVALLNDKIAPYLSTMKMASGEKYADFADAVATEIEKVNSDVAARGKKSAAKEKGEAAEG